MAFTSPKAGGWAFGEILTSAQMNQFNTDHPNAIDGAGGGSYAPSAVIEIDGSGVTMTGPLNIPSMSVFNVKAEEYGAVGDGSTDDTAAIQAAMDAAAAAGGGVAYFPEGTYRITAALDWDESVNLAGAGSLNTAITIDHASANALSASGAAATGFKFCVDLQFTATQANSGNIASIAHANACSTVFQRCVFGTSLNQGVTIALSNAAHRLWLEECRLNPQVAAITHGSTTGRVFAKSCEFVAPATYGSDMVELAGHGFFSACNFDFSGNTTGSNSVLQSTNASGSITAVGCRVAPGSGTTTVFSWPTGGTVVETGTQWPAASATFIKYSQSSGVASVNSALESMRHVTAATAGTTYTIPNGVRSLSLSGSSTEPTITMPAMHYPGQMLYLVVRNDSGGNWSGPFVLSGIDSASNSANIPNLTAGTQASVILMVVDANNDTTFTWMKIAP